MNGISVLPLGDYSFGSPSRITARTYVGSEGLINIDKPQTTSSSNGAGEPAERVPV